MRPSKRGTKIFGGLHPKNGAEPTSIPFIWDRPSGNQPLGLRAWHDQITLNPLRVCAIMNRRHRMAPAKHRY